MKTVSGAINLGTLLSYIMQVDPLANGIPTSDEAKAAAVALADRAAYSGACAITANDVRQNWNRALKPRPHGQILDAATMIAAKAEVDMNSGFCELAQNETIFAIALFWASGTPDAEAAEPIKRIRRLESELVIRRIKDELLRSEEKNGDQG